MLDTRTYNVVIAHIDGALEKVLRADRLMRENDPENDDVRSGIFNAEDSLRKARAGILNQWKPS